MIPVFDLTRQYQRLKKELNTSFIQTNERGQFILGKEVSRFEKEFAKFIGVSYGVGVASGTDALMLGLTALGVGQGDEVILPANSYPTAFGVSLSGAAVRLVDVTSDGTMDPKKLVVTKKTKAVVPVHIYGNAADSTGIKRLLPEAVAVLEDAAQAHGAPVGKSGDAAAFSFYPTKNLGALGDAGIVVTNRKDVADRLAKLRVYGETIRYHSEEISGVSRLDELHAAILRVKLRHLRRWVARRRTIAKYYVHALSGVGDVSFVHPLLRMDDCAFHLFVIRTKTRDRLAQYLRRHGVATAIHYPVPISLTPAFAAAGYHKGDFPVAEALSREILSVPMFPELADNEVETIVRTIRRFFR